MIIKKHETLAQNFSLQIYPNKIRNRIFNEVKTGCKLELVSPETLRLLGSAKKDVNQDKHGEDVPKLESVKVTFVPNKQLGQLINIVPHS